MLETKILSLPKAKIIVLAQFASLLAVASITPALIHSQPITGPIVNAVLFIATVILGTQGAVLIALIPSLIALSVGLLPQALAPMVPFIMMSNVILVLVFNYVRKRNLEAKKSYWTGLISASVLKFLFLFSTSFVVVNLITKQAVAQKAAAILSWPQLLTALAGGVIAYLVLRVASLKENNKNATLFRQ